MNKFIIFPTNTYIWNHDEFLQFLVDNQGQDIELNLNNEGSCLISNGVYAMLDKFDFKSVTIHTYNAIEQHDRYKIVLDPNYLMFFSVPFINYTEYHHWNRNTVFGVFYNRALWYRIGLAATLQHDYPQLTTLNFRYSPHNVDQRKEFELAELFNADPDSVTKFMSVYQQWPVQLEKQDGYTVGVTTRQHTNQLAQFYPDFLIDVVAESFVEGRTFYATEKVVRPMLLKKPFIVMGSKCFLIYLRQLGFRTFHDFWDEDYDGYAGKSRYRAILKLIDELAQRQDFDTLYKGMQEVLDHNYNLLVTKSYNRNISYVA